MPSGDSRATSASELADFAYCPRSYWYRTHPPPGGPTRASVRSTAAGNRAHAHQLGGERRRAERGGLYWVLLLVGAAIAVGGLALWW